MSYRGFDVYVNMVLEDVVEYDVSPDGKRVRFYRMCWDSLLVNSLHSFQKTI